MDSKMLLASIKTEVFPEVGPHEGKAEVITGCSEILGNAKKSFKI